MKGVLLALLALCVCLASAQSSTCAVLDTYRNTFAISSADYNTTDDYGKVQGNLCKDLERSCARTSNAPCSLCQWIGEGTPSQHSWCIGFNQGETYVPLDATAYPNTKGFRAVLQGDLCGANPRQTYIDVFCNSPSTYLEFVDENITCTYNFKFYQTGNCDVTPQAFTPSFNITIITPTSLTIVIDDAYPWQFWTYNVKVNNVLAYSGTSRDVIVRGLTAGTSYSVVVERVAGTGAAFPVTSPAVTKTVSTLPKKVSAATSTVVKTGKGAGIAIGMVIAVVIVAALFGIYKFALPILADKFGGSTGGGSKKTGGYLMQHDADDLVE